MCTCTTAFHCTRECVCVCEGLRVRVRRRSIVPGSVCVKDYVYVYDGVPLYPGVCVCVKDYVYVYDGVPLYPGFSSEGATLLAALCGSNVDETLTVTAESGVMTVFFEAFVDPSSASLSCVFV